MTDHLKKTKANAEKRIPGDVQALQAAFERQVLRGIAAEWENARWLVPPDLQDALRPPLFSIRETHSRLGSWNPARREISLSRDLVSRHRWDDIRDVLLHEMAHQIAHEVFHATTERAHGDRFREACRMLNADPAASGRFRPLRERLYRVEPMDAADRMVIRIRKLMALAESSNPNEARAAMAKAYELIARHNIGLIDRGERQTYISVFAGHPRLRHFREAYHLAHLLQDYYFVQGVWVQAWVAEKGKMGRVLEISGTRKNVQIAEYVHASVDRYIDSAWNAYRRGKRLGRSRKTDFAIGIIQGFKSTLKAAARGVMPQNAGSLPATLTDQALTRYVAGRYTGIRSFTRQGPGHDARILADGTATGKKLVIAKGITRSDGYRQRLIRAPD